MTWAELSPLLYFVALIALLLSAGFSLLPWKRAGLVGGVLSVLGFFLLVVAGCLTLHFLAEGDFSPKILSRGWIGPRDQSGALTVGAYQDFLGVTFSVFIGAVSLALSLLRVFGQGGPRPRTICGLVFSVSGAVVAWLSLTPWICLAAVFLTIFGGFLAFSEEWAEARGSDHALRFLRERSLGLLIAVLGAAALLSSRSAIHWDNKADLSTFSGITGFDLFSIALFYFGLFIQFQPFPFQSWLKAPSSTPLLSRIFLGQALPAATGFALLYRMEPYLKASGTLNTFGVVALFSAGLIAIFGIFQKDWRTTVTAWLSSGFSLCVAAIALGETGAGYPILIGLVLASALLTVSLEQKSGSASSPFVFHYMRALSGLSILGSLGVLGFFGGEGMWEWLTQLDLGSGSSIGALFVLLLFVVCAAVAFLRFKDDPALKVLNWPSLVVSSLLFLGSLAIVWTGAFLGSLSPNLFFSMSEHFYEKSNSALASGGTYWVYLGIAAVSFGIAALLLRKNPKNKDALAALNEHAPRFYEFISSGYRLDELASASMRYLIVAGQFTQKWIDLRFWSAWVPRVLDRGTLGTAEPVDAVDTSVRSGIRHGIRTVVEVPAKLIQLIQNGDVQWYLFFAIGSGLAMLLHFVREKP